MYTDCDTIICDINLHIICDISLGCLNTSAPFSVFLHALFWACVLTHYISICTCELSVWFAFAHSYCKFYVCVHCLNMASGSTPTFVPVTYKRRKPAHRVLHESGFKLIPSPGDGHCLIHAFFLSWSVQLITRSCPTFEDVRSRIFLEAVSHRDLYILKIIY